MKSYRNLTSLMPEEECLKDRDKFIAKPYSRPQTAFRAEHDDQFKSNSLNIRDNILDFKSKLKNLMRPKPKGFKSLFELDK